MAVLRSPSKTKASDSQTRASTSTSSGRGSGGVGEGEVAGGQGLISEAALVFTGRHDMTGCDMTYHDLPYRSI